MKSSFVPSFCPNPLCSNHTLDRRSPQKDDKHFFQFFGAYYTKREGWIPRYRCRSCLRTFSPPTFNLNYYAKKKLDMCRIFYSISAAQSVASIARTMYCSPESIQNRLERLGRASLSFHSRMSNDLYYSEDLVADGFENFERSQYFPSNLNILVGADSQFLYALTHVTLRRKGKMTTYQKATRALIEQRFHPPLGAIATSFFSLIKELPCHWDRSLMPILCLRTDEHPAYPKALLRIPELVQASSARAFHHITFPSTLPRTLTNKLFSVNYWDREFRKDIAAFRRETTCITRNVGSGLLRTSCHILWHNYRKPYRVRKEWTVKSLQTHAEIAGIDEEKIEKAWPTLFLNRPFPSRDPLPQWAVPIWERSYPTPLATNADYVPNFWRIPLLHQQGSGF